MTTKLIVLLILNLAMVLTSCTSGFLKDIGSFKIIEQFDFSAQDTHVKENMDVRFSNKNVP